MKSLCQVGLDLVRQRSDDETQHRRSAHTAQYQKALESITEAAADPLRNVQACKSITDQLEHWNFLLHRSYMTSEVYRPFLKRQDDTNLDFKDNRKKCIEALAETVNAYLGLENITQSAHQSWAAVHRALSSGLLLAIVKEHLRSERVQMLLERLIDVVSNLRSDTDTADISTPITRSISALSSLVDLDSERGLGKSKTQQRQWVPGQSQMPTVVHESLPTPTGSDNAKHSSPYKVRDQILWGS